MAVVVALWRLATDHKDSPTRTLCVALHVVDTEERVEDG